MTLSTFFMITLAYFSVTFCLTVWLLKRGNAKG